MRTTEPLIPAEMRPCPRCDGSQWSMQDDSWSCQTCGHTDGGEPRTTSPSPPKGATSDAQARIDWLATRAARELESALGKFDSFNSPHEGLAVIWEEFEELKRHVWENTARYSDAMDEAVQIAAMALRYVHDLAEWGPGYAAD